MFEDGRSRKVVFAAHCILNQNAISDGTASFAGMNETVVRLLLEANVGVVQMPCPEMNCLGLDRGDPNGAQRPLLKENSRIRCELTRQAGARRVLNALVEQVVYQMEEYRKNGVEVLGILGINRSPSCGVETTSADGLETAGEGVFLRALHEEMTRRGIDVPIAGIKDSEPEKTARTVRRILRLTEANSSDLEKERGRV